MKVGRNGDDEPLGRRLLLPASSNSSSRLRAAVDVAKTVVKWKYDFKKRISTAARSLARNITPKDKARQGSAVQFNAGTR